MAVGRARRPEVREAWAAGRPGGREGGTFLGSACVDAIKSCDFRFEFYRRSTGADTRLSAKSGRSNYPQEFPDLRDPIPIGP